MNTVKEIENEIENLEKEIKPLNSKLNSLHHQKRNLMSKEFIRVNNITKDDVEFYTGDEDKPYFFCITNFIEWLKRNSNKRFAEWNGGIYFQSDLKAGRMPEATPAFVEHLPD